MYLIGDIHGDFFTLRDILDKIPPEETVIQVGDLGIWPQLTPRWKRAGIDRDVHFIDGNHDYIPWLDADSPERIEIWPHAFYVPRGLAFPVDDKKVLFLGGSKSVDRAFRTKDSAGYGWFEGEQLTEAQAERAIKAGPVDIIISHTPPDRVIEKEFGRSGLLAFNVNPKTWIDESARLVERVWKELKYPMLYCGHMHQSVTGMDFRILNINEVLEVK